MTAVTRIHKYARDIYHSVADYVVLFDVGHTFNVCSDTLSAK